MATTFCVGEPVDDGADVEPQRLVGFQRERIAALPLLCPRENLRSGRGFALEQRGDHAGRRRDDGNGGRTAGHQLVDPDLPLGGRLRATTRPIAQGREIGDEHDPDGAVAAARSCGRLPGIPGLAADVVRAITPSGKPALAIRIRPFTSMPL